MENKKTNKKVFTGLVVSDKMDKTIVVKITTKVLHPLYKKYLTKSVKYKAHDENNDGEDDNGFCWSAHSHLKYPSLWLRLSGRQIVGT